MYAGVGASRIRKLFKEARRHKACIIFIDELDASEKSWRQLARVHEERNRPLNPAARRDGRFHAVEKAPLSIGATNATTSSTRRCSAQARFDRQVMVGNPDIKGREQILRVHAKEGRARTRSRFARPLRAARPDFSGADLANLVNEAALIAARAGRKSSATRSRRRARQGADGCRAQVGRDERTRARDLRLSRAATRRGGAASRRDPLHKVTIIPRGRALGVTMQLPEADRYTHSKPFIETQIAILMGGRIAEELFLGR
jgi:cell division protease FtsH